MMALRGSALADAVAGDSRQLAIRRIDAIPVRLPLSKPMLMAEVQISYSENLLIRVECESGDVGWGEATAAPLHGGETLDSMLKSFRDTVAPYVAGKNALRLSGLSKALETSVGSSVRAALEIALYDVAGKFLKVPVWALLGGKVRESVSPLTLIGTGSVDADLSAASERYREGHRFFKLKLGVKPLQEDIECTLAVRSMFGDSVRICADANTGFSLEQASAYARGVASAGLDFLEQPLARDDMEGLRQLAALQLIPVSLDESINSVSDVLRFWPAGISGIAMKTLKLGGFSGVLSTSHVCEALGLKINLSGKVAETSIASAALLHLAAVLPTVHWGVSPSHQYLSQDVVCNPIGMIGSEFAVSDLCGLGIEVDEGLVRDVTIR